VMWQKPRLLKNDRVVIIRVVVNPRKLNS